MAEPRILTKNYLSTDCVFFASHGTTGISYIHDLDSETKYITSGANDNDTIIQLSATLREGESEIDRTFDTVILLNHNLADVSVSCYINSSWVPGYNGNITGPNTVLTFNALTGRNFLLQAGKTTPADQEKSIGEIIVCKSALDIDKDFTSYDVNYRQKVKELTLGDGSIHQVVTRHSTNKTQKYGCSWTFDLVSQSTHDSLQAIKETGEPFLWQPESITRPELVYFVHWSSAWKSKYSSSYKGAGYEISGTFKEV